MVRQTDFQYFLYPFINNIIYFSLLSFYPPRSEDMTIISIFVRDDSEELYTKWDRTFSL